MVTVISELPQESFNYGCNDPVLETTQKYDFKYIERTVYQLAQVNDALGRDVKTALEVIEKAYKEYG